MKGLQRAHAAGLGEAAVFLSVTESHSRKNINKDGGRGGGDRPRGGPGGAAAGDARALLPVHGVGLSLRAPYAGGGGSGAGEAAGDLGIEQLSLDDTIGIGTPAQTAQIVSEVSKVIPVSRLALHLHDSRGTALANALVGLSMGITTFDSSIGGLGGCPYAPGAASNLATEDLVFMLYGMGVQTGIDWGGWWRPASWLRS